MERHSVICQEESGHILGLLVVEARANVREGVKQVGGHSKDDGFDQMADARPSKSALQVGEESGLDAGQKTFLFLTITLFHLWCVHLDSGVCLAGSMQYIKNLLDCNGANLGGLPQNEGRKNPLYKDKTFLLIGKSNAKLAKIQ